LRGAYNGDAPADNAQRDALGVQPLAFGPFWQGGIYVQRKKLSSIIGAALAVAALAGQQELGVAGGTSSNATAPGYYSIKEFTLPTTGASPRGIVAGPDGNVWFTEFGGKVGRIQPTGAVSEFSTPTASSGVTGITTGPDGNFGSPR
jgi:streptogramin lyase